MIGPMRRVFGGAKGEQLVFDGDKLFRVKPDGKRKRLKLTGLDVERAEVAPVVEAIRSFEAKPSVAGE